jgi:hypothetical protein
MSGLDRSLITPRKCGPIHSVTVGVVQQVLGFDSARCEGTDWTGHNGRR